MDKETEKRLLEQYLTFSPEQQRIALRALRALEASGKPKRSHLYPDPDNPKAPQKDLDPIPGEPPVPAQKMQTIEVRTLNGVIKVQVPEVENVGAKGGVSLKTPAGAAVKMRTIEVWRPEGGFSTIQVPEVADVSDQRKPTKDEERLMILLSCDSLKELNEFLNSPSVSSEESQSEPPYEEYELAEEEQEDQWGGFADYCKMHPASQESAQMAEDGLQSLSTNSEKNLMSDSKGFTEGTMDRQGMPPFENSGWAAMEAEARRRDELRERLRFETTGVALPYRLKANETRSILREILFPPNLKETDFLYRYPLVRWALLALELTVILFLLGLLDISL
jgi:hypothetical protein